MTIIFEMATKKCVKSLGFFILRKCSRNLVVREPAILLIKWLRPKGLKMCSYVEKYAEFKNQTLKKSAGTQKCYAQRNTPGVGNFSN